jgi:hypothetical protein
LKALIVKLFRNIPSDRQLYRRLWSDPELRELCDIKEYETLSSIPDYAFQERIGPEKPEYMMEALVGRLRDAEVIRGEIVASIPHSLKHPASIHRMTQETVTI